MTTLPIYWAEAEDMGALLKGDARPAEVRKTLELSYTLEPLDTLDDASLGPHSRLILAQPRVLAPSENVALDDWVRAGGRLLLFADPMLTRHSRFAVGDKRRSQDVVLLSPILARWGVALAFDAEQPAAERMVDIDGTPIPVTVAGRLRSRDDNACRVSADILAVCRIGRGRVTVLADAAVLEDAEDGNPAVRAAAVVMLTRRAFQ